jgi:hypothetical protein
MLRHASEKAPARRSTTDIGFGAFDRRHVTSRRPQCALGGSVLWTQESASNEECASVTQTKIFFSDYFGVDKDVLDAYGAFDVNLVTDLPLFIDPFLLFNSKKQQYQELHESIVDYLKYLKQLSQQPQTRATIKYLYVFGEVKQNWLGYSEFGNEGRGLGLKFATSLHGALGSVLKNFGDEEITKGTHLEKLSLVQPGVGRDNISDFTTNLIKEFLLGYTETFAKKCLTPVHCTTFHVDRVRFNYTTESWESETYFLPKLRDDYVLLTPLDFLTHDETWINYKDMVRQYHRIAESVENDVARNRIDRYFRGRLGEKPKESDIAAAAAATLRNFPELIDRYIAVQEADGDRATAISKEKREEILGVFETTVREAVKDLAAKSDFYDKSWTSYDEARERVLIFKHYVEDQDGYRLINRKGTGFARESEVQIFFGLIWGLSDFDVNREPNNGRGPVDFKVSYGSGDKSLIEFKLASNRKLEQNLLHQVEVYEAANDTTKSLKVIVFYTEAEEARVRAMIKKVKLETDSSVVLIDARSDNKPSASVAK